MFLDDQNLPNPENDYANIVPDSIGMESPPWTPISNNINTIENLPCSALNWKIYLEDLMKAKKERQKRIERESEKVSEFLKRFPLVDDFAL
ncbi:uncharacterized protein LOC119686423 [Teleopsis dalmanni]|uniref:uncharacterized protein LOC119686423 n=1 Tax=Teleopsis dalmanni TaxID=139649 RepID=UPI0018CEA07B|nr:uncharacterized protein LOC119686423 [Teleopsis dalmanni]